MIQTAQPDVQPVIDNDVVTKSVSELISDGVTRIEDLHDLSKRALIDEVYVSHPDAGFEEPYIDRESFDRYSGVEYTHDFWLVKDGAAYCIMLNDYEAVYNSFTQNGWQVSYVTSEHANTQDAMWQELFGEPEFKPMYVTTEKAVESLRD